MKSTTIHRLVICLVAMVMGIQISIVPTNAVSYTTGDVNGDGSITVEDACLVLEDYARRSAGLSSYLYTEQEIIADVNGDEQIAVEDAVYILQYYAQQSAGLQPDWKELTMSAEERKAWTYSKTVLELMNQQRATNGVQALQTDDLLYQAAMIRAKELEQSFSHARPNGEDPFTVLDAYEISYYAAGENIAKGYATPESVMNAWMNSKGHRANILDSDFQSAAVGVYQNASGTYYWSIFFIG